MSTSGSLREAKNALRTVMAARRRRLVPRLRDHLSTRIAERVLSSPDYQQAESVLLYAALEPEVQTAELLQTILASGRTVALPRMEGERLVAHLIRDPEQDLQTGRFGVREPRPETCAVISVDELDLLLVPGVAFDGAGGRLGHGEGFYDRFLGEKTSDAPVYGLAFGHQVVAEVPMSEQDVTVDGVVTEEDFLAPDTLTLELDSPEAMQALGERLAGMLEPPVLLALVGELGAGKTTLTQGLLRGFGAGESAVSPTYLLINEYDAKVPVRHLDAYRLGEEKLTLEDREILIEALEHDGVTIVEWADRVPSLLPSTRVWIAIETMGAEGRRVRIATVRRRDALERTRLAG